MQRDHDPRQRPFAFKEPRNYPQLKKSVFKRLPDSAGTVDSRVMNVLIVEDNKPVSLLISRVAEEAGHTCFIAANGEVALRLYGQRDIDLMIVDVELPGIDGFDVAREVRNQSAHLPIIVISGNQGEVWRQQAIDAGANEFVPKPIRPSSLQTVLERHLPQVSDQSAHNL